MSVTNKKILTALEIQEGKEGLTENIKILRQFLSCIKSASQWTAFTTVKFNRYGIYSYQCNKFYYCKPELLKLLNIKIEA